MAGQHVVARDTKRIEVAPRIDSPPFHLLRAHVQRRSHRDADLRQVQRFAVAHDAGQAKIGDLHLAARRNHDVFRLDVAMNDLLLGRFVQTGGHLANDVHRLDCIDPVPQPSQKLLQVLARHIFLGNVVGAVAATDFVNLHDVGMDQLRGRLGFVLEAANISIVTGQILPQHLQGNLPAERQMFGQIDLGHAPAPQPPQQLIIANLATGEVRLRSLFGRCHRRGGSCRHAKAWREASVNQGGRTGGQQESVLVGQTLSGGGNP